MGKQHESLDEIRMVLDLHERALRFIEANPEYLNRGQWRVTELVRINFVGWQLYVSVGGKEAYEWRKGQNAAHMHTRYTPALVREALHALNHAQVLDDLAKIRA